MQPTGMSAKRCVAALTALSGELDRVAVNGADPLTARVAPWVLQTLIQDLVLDIDLRNDAAAKSAMSEIESDVYLPVIEKVLALLRHAESVESRSQPVTDAKELTHAALRRAVERASVGSP